MMSNVLELYFIVKAGGDEYFVSDIQDLQWLLLDYPDATANCYTKDHHVLMYENKPLSEFTRKPNIDANQREFRKQLV